ncbi:MAG TPA: neutral/alkaline non-lysosomal ceramidase N-terminal domain-containing protein, partial [Acidimicrobiales bacterium]|nr:neutral/alkaline non-lysosomal ceramidase N-terminal domain-containing protein [Acidimicrobiales bacterium]
MNDTAPPPRYLVGRGIADITGEPAECGMLGYGQAHQRTTGIHLRLRSRAFVFVDTQTDRRVVLSINEVPLLIDTLHAGVLKRLTSHYVDLYDDANVVLTATHTHCGPGGYSHHRLYNSNTGGFRPATYEAIVGGIVDAIHMAHDDVAPASLALGFAELHDASVNRSPGSFARNPEADRAHFPAAIDPQTTTLAIERDGEAVGAINWFPTHGTSMTNRNTLISSDNKGYAAWAWERLDHDVDYRADRRKPPTFVGAFAQTNTGDMSPNLDRGPGSGPTAEEFTNTRLIGQRQLDAARTGLDDAEPIDGPIGSAVLWVDLSDQTVGAPYTPDGATHRTGPPAAGAAAFAGTDEGPAFPGFEQGVDNNRVVGAISRRVVYPLSKRLAEAHAPKAIVVPPAIAAQMVDLSLVPVQLVQLGSLYLVTIPGEVTIVAGLRIRRRVAQILGVELAHVLIAGYSNGYIHYVTTPEEYTAQRYEGGSTMFGRWQQPALEQIAARLAEAMIDGHTLESGMPSGDKRPPRAARPHTTPDAAPAGARLGDVVTPPRSTYRPGDRVRAVFAGTYPNNDLRTGDTYLLIERRGNADGDQATDVWTAIAD